ncbi:glycosyltransferase [Galbitalea sp. SE-J8]|uniref:glycosyltransferase family 2 protein n=1 Tax=Galbitalea sp. SE-J8 TaxID=3054952 RepID=UPI00259CE5E9|nr:glycosyltransferase [Galbitalea sp. SE-J8]MDM4762956.1 glycosyltransferase [Galbitalea sp. SE-J8]
MTIDIMLPFWGRFDHFREAVESVRAQTRTDWRLTVVDDVYPDLEPGRWVQGLGDDRITYLRNSENLGTSRNYLKCVSLMSADRAVIMGCDDVMLPDYLETVDRLIADHPDAGVIQPGAQVIDEDGVVYLPPADRMKRLLMPRGHGTRSYRGEGIATSLLRGNWTYFPSLVWRVDLLRRYGFDPDLTIVQDLGMLLDIIAGGDEFVLDDRTVFQYRRHAASLSSSAAVDGSRFRQERELFDRERSRFRALGWRRASRAAARHASSRLHALMLVPRALRAGDRNGVRILTAHGLG